MATSSFAPQVSKLSLGAPTTSLNSGVESRGSLREYCGNQETEHSKSIALRQSLSSPGKAEEKNPDLSIRRKKTISRTNSILELEGFTVIITSPLHHYSWKRFSGIEGSSPSRLDSLWTLVFN